MRSLLTRQLAELEALFDLVRQVARAHGLAPDLEKDLCVIAEELFTNQVRHARPGGPRIEFVIEVGEDRIQMELIDDDVEPWDPTAAPEVDVDRPIEERKPGGLGLHFVRTLSDEFEWTYDAGRRRSRITVTRRLER